MSKIHPHLKSFIKSVVLAELGSSAGTSKSYLWKETLMREVLSSVLENLPQYTQEEQVKEEIVKQVAKRKVEINNALSMIENTLKQIPLDVLKRTP